MQPANKGRCLVLGCGGVTGLAWEIGVLAGLLGSLACLLTGWGL